MAELLDLSASSGTSAQQPSPSSVPAAPAVPPPTAPVLNCGVLTFPFPSVSPSDPLRPPSDMDATSALSAARADGFGFAVTSLSTPSDPVRRDVTDMGGPGWTDGIVGAARGPRLHDVHAHFEADDPVVRRAAEHDLAYQLDWAAHMGIPAVLLPFPCTGPYPHTYARCLAGHALAASARGLQLWVRLPLTAAGYDRARRLVDAADGVAALGIALDVGPAVADGAASSPGGLGAAVALLHLFLGQNVRACCVGTVDYATNRRGYPALRRPAAGAAVCGAAADRAAGAAVAGGAVRARGHGGAGGVRADRAAAVFGVPASSAGTAGGGGRAGFGGGDEETPYLDYLQSPLQPLADDLEFGTYEVFERDPVKYDRYRDGIASALRDGTAGDVYGKVKTEEGGQEKVEVAIYVLGAGRGPLVRAALAAVALVNAAAPPTSLTIVPRVVALEKNPSAVIFLNSLVAFEPGWAGTVSVAACDMRVASSHPVVAGRPADIIVSELLGSFGDNELSPECLDGAQAAGLTKTSTVSVPQSYVSYLAPVSSPRLWAEARSQAYSAGCPRAGPGGAPGGIQRATETPYVVRPHASAQTHAERRCFEYSHPCPEDAAPPGPDGTAACFPGPPGRNDRYARLRFGPGEAARAAGRGCGYGLADARLGAVAADADAEAVGTTIHGFLGTFDCVLHEPVRGDAVRISTCPRNFSVGMFSWFPLYFPLSGPLRVPPGGSVVASVWRRSDDDSVWYEWTAEAEGPDGETVATTTVHNVEGRSYKIRL
eukprot:CAMPEP_0194328496 /NCGR_PEP_ID=MMETSP0171-20130528/45039_1 /TAXON_ID=218684 /ORGANISM="Corethron pennatum, Strain L29A3" /LENGTH=770 /DNA_ID=CAMNT_0039088875 /DNA_START=8 /DNA_END=2320 /DNA_ORIENTATION=+